MAKYSKKLINSYLLGEEVKGVKFEELENDTDFMIAVIDQSNDKEMIHYAGDNVKNDQYFVRFLITKFHDDVEFIEKIADDYKKTLNDEDGCEALEINILLEKAFHDISEENDKYNFYRLYNLLNVNLKATIFKLQKFINVEHFYIDYDLIVEYMAKEFLFNIFDKELYPLERYLHNNIASREEISPSKAASTLLSIIQSYDSCLYWYVARHMYLIDNLLIKLLDFYKRWDYYARETILDKKEILKKNIENMLDNNDDITLYHSENLTSYVIKMLLAKYNNSLELKKFLTYEEEDIKLMKFALGEIPSLQDQINIKKGFEMAIRIFIKNETYIEENQTDVDKKPNKEGIICHIDDDKTTKK